MQHLSEGRWKTGGGGKTGQTQHRLECPSLLPRLNSQPAGQVNHSIPNRGSESDLSEGRELVSPRDKPVGKLHRKQLKVNHKKELGSRDSMKPLNKSENPS